MGQTNAKIELTLIDITKLNVDCIVNAANESLLGGGGVDGAIHRAAGPKLLAATRAIGGCPTGESRLTPGFRLKANWILHTVGPVWHGGKQNESELLASCYRSAMKLGSNPNHNIKTIAFPAISTGVYDFPTSLAAEIALAELNRALSRSSQISTEVIACHSERSLATYQAAAKKAGIRVSSHKPRRSLRFWTWGRG